MKQILLFYFLCFSLTVIAQPPKNYVLDKNFRLLSLLNKLPQLPVHRSQPQKTATDCNTDIGCQVQLYWWTGDETIRIGTELKQLAVTDPKIKNMLKGQLRPSHVFISYEKLSDGELLEKAWVDAANGMNHIMKTYGLGKHPSYPDIDSVSYKVHSKSYGNLIRTISKQIAQTSNYKAQFFEPALQFTLDLLEANNRDEAGRAEPLSLTNATAIAYSKTLNWKKYPYSIMLIPGSGNDLPNVSLSPWGKIRLKIAVEAYRKGLAPFILVSGGYVHPFQTPYCEAFEMKKYLMQHYNIPAKAILIDPHARHTTTNIRNACRIIYNDGLPWIKKALIITDEDQSAYIEAPQFATRNLKELGYVPYAALKRISVYQLEFLPVKDCLQYDSRDPLDP